MRTYRNLTDSVSNFVDRRGHMRISIKSVAYVDLGHENGGLILNLSEGGIAMHVAEIVEGAAFEKLRFQLPDSEQWVEAGGQMVWHGRSKKKAGVRFVNLSDEARRQIRNWIDSRRARSDAPARDFVPVPEAEREVEESGARSEDSGDSGSEFDLAFPSENPGEAEVHAGHGPVARGLPKPPANHASGAGNRDGSGVARNHEPITEQESVEKETSSPTTAASDGGANTDPKAPWRAAHNSMFDRDSRTDPFADVEYRLGGSDWSGTNWGAIAVIALVILVAGSVLAVGPSNVKAIFARKATALVSAPPEARSNENVAAPLPPAAEDAEIDQAPLNPAPTQPNASAATPAKSEAGASGSASVDQGAKSAGEKTPQRAAEQASVAKANAGAQSDSSDDAESAEEMTRKFQAEHRDAPLEATNGAVVEMNPAPGASPYAAGPTKSALPPSSGAPRTGQSSASATPVSTSAGLVAISSHFQSVQGVAADEFDNDSRPKVGQLVSIKQPVYPAEAVRAHVEGTVRLRLVVDQIGRVEAVYVVSGPPMLVPAAIGAAREWRYDGTVLDAKAVKSVEDVAMVFRLGSSAESPRE
ncbi:MAG TPA: energy transducer TonB [Candidatus Baltobacteraceae bacterium]|nr:energy transducer TonB [Candidatus Baltobacteraceae bacterium]